MPFLLTEEVTNPGSGSSTTNLMSSGGHGNTYSLSVPQGFPHSSFGDCQTHFVEFFAATRLAVRHKRRAACQPAVESSNRRVQCGHRYAVM